MDVFTKIANEKNEDKRLDLLKKAKDGGELDSYKSANRVNNHIHTVYSFSPYTPTHAVLKAYSYGLSTAGIMDHDSISGAREFIKAGEIIGIKTTIGAELRASMEGTVLEDKKINNPDQKGIIYMALHGIPHTQIDKLTAFFKPYTEKRNERNRKIVENINSIFGKYSIKLDFDKDVLPISMYSCGGSVTERHVLYALALKILEIYPKGKSCAEFLKDTLGISLSEKIYGYLLNSENIHYSYDLLGVLKSEFIGRIYVDATDECPKIKEVIAFAKEIGAIAAYPYLGDVLVSVTGDKRAQKFEDEYIELLFETISELCFDAVTYMPSRNTSEQLARVMKLCDKHNLFQISGEDINSSRQSFVCDKLESKEFSHLVDATFALIGHEKMATDSLDDGMFSEKTKTKYPCIKDRIAVYKKYGEQ